MNDSGRAAIVAHDAGGAEILSSYVRRHKLDCIFGLEGPARKIFERKLGTIEIVPLEEAVSGGDYLLSGTGWQTDFEIRGIKLARTQGKRSIAFLDHWVNYVERFTRSGETVLPDEIWVGDTMAMAMANEAFPSTKIRLVENPYFQDIRDDIESIQKKPAESKKGIEVLYVCEPFREPAKKQYGDEYYWGYVEEDALRYFLSNIKKLGSNIERILIRPHPSEPEGKYDWVKAEFDLPIEIGGNGTLFEELANCDVVAGCQSMAMVVGLIAGKRVVSSIPPGGRRCVLPHREIEHLSKMP